MSDEELEKIANAIRVPGVAAKPWPLKHLEAVKLLRSIEIAALREAWSIAEKTECFGCDGWQCFNPAMAPLANRIRELELK